MSDKGITVTKIDGNARGCDWAMVDKHGMSYPHGIKARRRVTGAGEFDGDYCIPHATMAVEWSRDGVEILV